VLGQIGANLPLMQNISDPDNPKEIDPIGESWDLRMHAVILGGDRSDARADRIWPGAPGRLSPLIM